MAMTLTIAELDKLRPCSDEAPRVRKALRKLNSDPDHAFTAAEAREAGCTFHGILWATTEVAENDAIVERRLRHWMADCAARALHIFEDAYPGDKRPRQAIEAARLFADDEIDADALAAARDAASAAAWAAARAARDAARDAKDAAWAAWAAAWTAAWAVARDASAAAWAVSAAAWDARAAVRDAEEQRQFDRLILWLSDPEPVPIPLPDR